MMDEIEKVVNEKAELEAARLNSMSAVSQKRAQKRNLLHSHDGADGKMQLKLESGAYDAVEADGGQSRCAVGAGDKLSNKD